MERQLLNLKSVAMQIEPDELGDEYEKITIKQLDDYDGEVFVTLIRKPCAVPSKKAVLYIHGFIDYYFQTEMAEQYNAHGYNFYAVDLRKCGRSHRPHQILHFNKSFNEYEEDLNKAIEVITEQDGNTQLLLSAHSTGGISAALYADSGTYKDRINAVFLNSPFFGLNEPWFNRWFLNTFGGFISLILPKLIVQKISGLYAESMHKDHHGQWSFNTDWKPTTKFLVRVGWISSVINAHKIIHKGLNVSCPILLMHSDSYNKFKKWSEGMLKTDAILNIEHMKQHCANMGKDVTRIEIPDGAHDLILSEKTVRDSVYQQLFDWLNEKIK